MKGLVKRYKQDVQGIDKKQRDILITDYAPLIRFIAHRVAARLPSNIDINDLISAGVIGLMDAIDKYDPTRDNKFKTYAEFRIRGAILDELRSQDWVPRSIRDKAKQIERVYAELEQKLGRPVADQEVCDAMKIPLEEYYDLISKVKSITLLSIDEIVGQGSTDRKSLLDTLELSNSKNPFTQLKVKNIREMIAKHIEELPEKQQLVLSLYYYEDLNLKEIGKILEVTESRVSQLHTQAVEKLRAKLKEAVID